jgi:hypothetical protein
VPDFVADRPPSYRPPAGATGVAAISGADPFIMQADGKAWLFAPAGLVDGPLPAHYEPQESPFRNLLYGQQHNPVRQIIRHPENRYQPSGDQPGAGVFPYVTTTNRLTEHHTAGGMSRFLPYLSELQPAFFCEVSPQLAAERGLEHLGWATIITARAVAICARAGITSRPTCAAATAATSAKRMTISHHHPGKRCKPCVQQELDQLGPPRPHPRLSPSEVSEPLRPEASARQHLGTLGSKGCARCGRSSPSPRAVCRSRQRAIGPGMHTQRHPITPLAAVVAGLLAGAVGTASMDAVRYLRHRRAGGKESLLEWEFAPIDSWDQAPDPGQVAKRLIEGFTQRELPDRWAWLTSTIAHWCYGSAWAAVYGILVGSRRRRHALYGLPFAAVVWASGYVALPEAGLYKPILEYDAKTLADDLSAHLAYGVGTGAAFWLLARIL